MTDTQPVATFEITNALALLRNGQMLSRLGWPDGAYLEPAERSDEIALSHPMAVKRNINGGSEYWTPSIGDMIGTDWVQVDGDKVRQMAAMLAEGPPDTGEDGQD